VIAGGRSLSYTDAAAVTNGLASRLVAASCLTCPCTDRLEETLPARRRSRLVDVVAALGAGTIGGEAAIHALPTFLQRSVKRPSQAPDGPARGIAARAFIRSVEDAARARALQGESGVVAVEDRRQRRFLGHPAVAGPVQHVGRSLSSTVAGPRKTGARTESHSGGSTRRHPVRATRGTAGAPVLPGAATRSPARFPGSRGRETGSRRRGLRSS
jgi:hypothetical protein